MPEHFSNWDDATRRAKEATLICPFCTAANARGKTVIELGRDGRAICAVCSKTWTPEREAR